MSTGARAMATALVLQADGRRDDGRWKRGSVLGGDNHEFVNSGWRERLRECGVILDNLPDLAGAVVAGDLALGNAYEQAETVRTSADHKKITSHVTEDGSVIVPPRIAHWLETKAGVTADWRDRLRDTDLEAHQVMAALHWVATQHRSGIGTNSPVGQRTKAESQVWLSTCEAAREMKVTDRCIRKWIYMGRLPATMPGCRWLIRRNDLTALARTA
jgi:excisionase family DNA binding protein